MKFKHKFTVTKTTPPQKLPFLESLGGSEQDQRDECRQGGAVLTKLIIDDFTYIPMNYPFADKGQQTVVADVAEILGVWVSIDIDTGEIVIEVPEDCTYQINGVEIGVLVKEPKLLA